MRLFPALVLIAWLPAVLIAFAWQRGSGRHTGITALVLGWLFLPMADCGALGLPRYSKWAAVAVPVLLGIACFDRQRLKGLRPRLADGPMLLFCLSGFASSVSNGLGIADGLSEALSAVITWALSYLIGRIYLTDTSAWRSMIAAILMGGLMYVPFCLTEIMLSPQWHNWIYGYHQHSFLQTMRDGGYRPMVFMQHGLMLSFWMTVSTLVAGVLWYEGTIRSYFTVPISVCCLMLLTTTILCKSTGAMILLVVGVIILVLCRVTKLPRLLLMVIVCFPPLHVMARVTQFLPREVQCNFTSALGFEEKVGSMRARLIQEDLFSAHALRQPVFGWGGWMRNFPTDPVTGKRLTRGLDGYWTMVISEKGLFGLTAFLAMFTVPILFALWRITLPEQPRTKFSETFLPIVILELFFIECIPNGMLNPVYIVLLGGLASMPYAPALRTERTSTDASLKQRRHLGVRRALYPQAAER